MAFVLLILIDECGSSRQQFVDRQLIFHVQDTLLPVNISRSTLTLACISDQSLL